VLGARTAIVASILDACARSRSRASRSSVPQKTPTCAAAAEAQWKRSPGKNSYRSSLHAAGAFICTKQALKTIRPAPNPNQSARSLGHCSPKSHPAARKSRGHPHPILRYRILPLVRRSRLYRNRHSARINSKTKGKGNGLKISIPWLRPRGHFREYESLV
jgi:hypothetical protein